MDELENRVFSGFLVQSCNGDFVVASACLVVPHPKDSTKFVLRFDVPTDPGGTWAYDDDCIYATEADARAAQHSVFVQVRRQGWATMELAEIMAI